MCNCFPDLLLLPDCCIHAAFMLRACKSVHLLSNFKQADIISLMHWLFLCMEVQIRNDSLLPTALTFVMEHNVKRPTIPVFEGGRGHSGD